WLCLGAIDDALTEVDRTLEARAVGWGTFVPAALWVRARCLLDRGDVDAAEATLEMPAGEDESRFYASPLGVTLLGARAGALRARNAAAAALSTGREAGVIAEATGVRNPAFFPWRSGAALAASWLGDGAAARRLADEEVAMARGHGVPRAL